ncbi:MAG: ferrochelatase [Phycisphaerae bacterium]|nr:ferrochelatase [Phycisphaerae bacterium]
MSEPTYDAILVVSFGGPLGMEDVVPFLQNVTRGRNIPPQRLAEVGEHYAQFGGVSPHNRQIQDLIDALQARLDQAGPHLPVYWGNRNWKPMLEDTLRQMTDDGIRRAIAFVAAGYSSYSSCRQYREDIERARQAAGPAAPAVDKIRVFYNHPLFIETMQDRVREALERLPAGKRSSARLIFTAHSLPAAMAANCRYEHQLQEAARLIHAAFAENPWSLVYQSRSGPPQVPWLEPDVCDYLENQRAEGETDVVLVPVGFICDHLEVLFDLDTEAAELCERIGLNMVRAGTAGTHPKFVEMVRELICERIEKRPHRPSVGNDGPSHDVCPVDCCLPPRPPVRSAAGSAPVSSS